MNNVNVVMQNVIYNYKRHNTFVEYCVNLLYLFFTGFILLTGCHTPSSDPPSNVTTISDLDDSKIREKVFEGAIQETDLELLLNTSGEKIYYVNPKGSPYTGWVKDIRKLQQVQNGKKHGIYITWYGNWQRAIQGNYNKGLPDGLWIVWDPIGQKESEGIYNNGRRDGLWTTWNPDGEKSSEITYENGKVIKSVSLLQAESEISTDNSNIEDTEKPVFVLCGNAQKDDKLVLPKGAKYRLGRGGISNVQTSPDGKRLAVTTSIGLWIFNTDSGEEYAVPGEVGALYTFVFSPDGKTLATVSGRSGIRLWSADTGKLIMRIKEGYADKLLFSSDGRLLASVKRNKNTRLWDVSTGNHLHTFFTNTPDGISVSFSPGGDIFATAHGSTLELWDTLTGQKTHTFSGEENEFNTIQFSPDGSILATHYTNGRVRLWDTHTWREKHFTQLQQQDSVSMVLFSSDGSKLVYGHGNGTVTIWNVLTGEHLNTLSESNNGVRSLAINVDESILASGHLFGTIQIWDLGTGQLIKTWNIETSENEDIPYHDRHVKTIIYLSFNSGANTLVSQSETGVIKIWDLATGQQIKELSGFNKEQISASIFSPDGKIVAFGGGRGEIRRWNVLTGEYIDSFLENTGYISSIVYSPNGETLASGSWDGGIRLLDTQSGGQKVIYKDTIDDITCLSYSSDGKRLAGGTRNRDIHIFDLSTEQKIHTLKGHNSDVYSVAFSPDGNTLASGERNHSLHLWDIPTGRLKKVIKEHTHYVSDVLFTPDGKTLISGSWDYTIRFWDADTGEYRKTIEWVTISCLALSADGKILAAGSVFSGDNVYNSIRLWDIKTGKVLNTLYGHTNSISSVNFSPNGEMLVSSSHDGIVILWDDINTDVKGK
ncbi:hypothetical protein C6497_06245 [Candidatus Poribacteria bacterium]|nr:MAG: hypothetical protein C6497_06245 [Candidatus Poribacteria bacterium]